MRKDRKNKSVNLIIGASLAGFMLLFLLIGLLYTPYDPDAMSGGAKSRHLPWLTYLDAISLGVIF